MPNYQSLYAGQQIDAAIEEYLHNGNMAIVQYSSSESDWVEAHDSAKGKYCLSIKLTGRYSTGSFPKTLVREVLADGTVVPLDCTIDTHEDEHEYNTIYIDIYANVQKDVNISILSSKQPTYNAPVMLNQPRYESVGDGVHVATSKYNAQYTGQQIDNFVGEFVTSGTRGLRSYSIREDQWEDSTGTDIYIGKYVCEIMPDGEYVAGRFPKVSVYLDDGYDSCEIECDRKIEYSGQGSNHICVKIYSNIKKSVIVKLTNAKSNDDVDPVFANNSWETIRRVFRSGNASNYWSILDEKPVIIDGKTYMAHICDMQVGRYDLSDGSGKSNGVFELRELIKINDQTLFSMNESGTNSGGWADCFVRNQYMPMFYNKLPQDLASVISEVNVLSGIGGFYSGTQTSYSANKLFLPAETEIGSQVNSIGQAESPKGIFDYYRNDIDTLRKKKGIDSGEYYDYWLRSPRKENSSFFCIVFETGTLSTSPASYMLGVPILFAI